MRHKRNVSVRDPLAFFFISDFLSRRLSPPRRSTAGRGPLMIMCPTCGIFISEVGGFRIHKKQPLVSYTRFSQDRLEFDKRSKTKTQPGGGSRPQ
ncbi:hypothetical protein EVAR_29975_1 [Eumeta japonica]|uniref:C2H2-type domain-containing protein n=1 Tax=Eumeta variegata TaxID=151549 RepID=A0A4C1VGL8_EUMVA|nr:hypothetical protein EVAR_29975_1 [Eumeta japonica]